MWLRLGSFAEEFPAGRSVEDFLVRTSVVGWCWLAACAAARYRIRASRCWSLLPLGRLEARFRCRGIALGWAAADVELRSGS